MTPDRDIQEAEMPLPKEWGAVIGLLALGKAAVAGAGLGLAALGALGVAEALTAREMLLEIKPHYLDLAAGTGGIAGIVWRLLTR